MRLMEDNMESLSVLGGKGNFGFSATKIEELGATEYTLVTIALDRSGSVQSYKAELLDTVKATVNACQKAPRAENLLLRIIEFNDKLDEVHGFKLLKTIDVNDYQEPVTGGMTALFDAVYDSVGATGTYAAKLDDQDFGVNGICFIITDGADNKSIATPAMIEETLKKIVTDEQIESLVTVLIGVNTDDCRSYLEDFKNKAGLSQFVDVGDVTPGKLAKLAAFVSKSVSSQSQALGSGGPSQLLIF